MTEEQFDALVELIRTIADQTCWEHEDTEYYDRAREREVIARVKEKLVQPQKLRQMLISHRRRNGSQPRGE